MLMTSDVPPPIRPTLQPHRLRLGEPHDPPKAYLRFNVAGLTPRDEFRDIDPPVGRFAIINPELRLLEQLPEVTLPQPTSSRILRSRGGRRWYWRSCWSRCALKVRCSSRCKSCPRRGGPSPVAVNGRSLSLFCPQFLKESP